MRKQIVTLALAGSLGLTGAALLTPSLASAQTPGPSTSAVSERLTALKDALSGLVTDKTLTQAQADEAATTLTERVTEKVDRVGRGPGGHHRHDAARRDADSESDSDSDGTPATPGGTASATPSVGS